MSLARTCGTTLAGVEGQLVTVEAHGADGLPTFVMSGRPDSACRQGPDRIRAAFRSLDLELPLRRWTINLSPAAVPKVGSGLDLAVAAALLAAQEHVPAAVVDRVAHVGEIGLDGTVRPVPGVLPMVVSAAASGVREVLVPVDNAREAALVEGVDVHPVRTLLDVVHHHRARAAGGTADLPGPGPARHQDQRLPDLVDVAGQAQARAALEVAAAGGHHLLMVGPPGAGKTLLAERLPGILPALTPQDALDVSAVHSVLGALPAGGGLLTRPPFVAPHHNASMAAVVGGGSGTVRPGAVSRAHRGVLFLDEAPEFRRDVLDALRQPLESGEVVVARADRHVRMPARFQLVLACNPCPCGETGGRCSCPPARRAAYFSRLSGPLLDRVDVKVRLGAVTRADLSRGPGEPSEAVAARVQAARARQRERWAGLPFTVNAQAPGAFLRDGRWRLPGPDRRPLDQALDRGQLTLRGFDRCLRIAWTLADLAGLERPGYPQVRQALHLRDAVGVRAA
ncbi:YifB family Mg chelatase-like AAA ATPase [Ornithinimicrobium kibberense]|uniref:YifB family Mg chelatase-like AAA ATPase n=1 Tax=Ornithinimicrobium kibberense TaxID=282060 RepID=A0ABV5UYV9_9MICO|nr:YifB family Mg chelatase-like AAA ATPase [Ornithinimicrobium kibberense]